VNGEDTGIWKKFVVACIKVEELQKSIQIVRMARKLIKNLIKYLSNKILERYQYSSVLNMFIFLELKVKTLYVCVVCC
jgi:hypothetical protein